jgi:hypothetical protein
MKPFIRIGTLYLNVSDLIEVETNARRNEPTFGEETRQVACIRLTTRKLTIGVGPSDDATSVNVTYDFEHGTREADALLAWLESQTEDLLKDEPQESPMCV